MQQGTIMDWWYYYYAVDDMNSAISTVAQAQGLKDM
jgi:serine protease inhibitor ecotin